MGAREHFVYSVDQGGVLCLSDLGGLSDFRTKTPIFAHVKIDDRVRHRRF
jgi:hypothetical protein